MGFKEYLQKQTEIKQSPSNAADYISEQERLDAEDRMVRELENQQLGIQTPPEMGIKTSQKPESFYHFILENQYQDLEKLIRGYKDVLNKDKQWVIIAKEEHCFTDEESEEIVRTAQAHLSTDIKLGFMTEEEFRIMMLALVHEFEAQFTSIAETRYGRYGSYKAQMRMKELNLTILIALLSRIKSNYSRAIKGSENRMTHDSTKAQESLGGKDPRQPNYMTRGY
jgi:uncharacterized protein YecA (UPF0149 family)